MSALSSVSGGDWAAISALAVPKGIPGGVAIGEVWRDVASYFTPTNMVDAFKLCEFLYLTHPTYRKGSERVVDYFLTYLKLSGGDKAERKKFQELLEEDVKIMSNLRKVGINYMCYGNAILTPHFPFIRELRCRRCGTSRNARKLDDFKLDFATGDFLTTCPRCKGAACNHEAVDSAKLSPDEIKLITWDPKRLWIENNPYTDESLYYFRPSEYVKQQVRAQNTFFLATLPKGLLEAIRLDKKFKFNNDYLYHLRESEIAGLDLRGWGCPSVLTAFRNFFRLQILMKQDEKLMLDYITPMRMLSPKQGGYQDGNPIQNASMRTWMGNIGDMIQSHRIDGTNWNLVPFPVDYQAIGGEGRQLSPKELMEAEEDRLLNARGVPPEFFRASLTLQAAPVALRLFERSWSYLVSGYNEIAQWWSSLIANYLRAGEFKVGLQEVTVVDEIDSKIWRLQAMASELLSKETALSPMQIDSEEEFDKILEQQKSEQRKTQAMEQEMQMAQLSLDSQQGAPEEGGAGAAQGGGGATPMQVEAQADQLARQLLAMPEGDRHRQLAAIRSSGDITLHATVLKKMDMLRGQARSMGQDMAMQQVLQQPPAQQGGGAPQQ